MKGGESIVKERLVEETAKGNWSGAVGIGLIGLVLTVGVTPVLVALLIALGIGITLTVYFLPVVLSASVGGFVFIVSWKIADLKGIKLIVPPLIAGAGALMLFTFTDLTLWGVSSAESFGVSGQWLVEDIKTIITGMVKTLQLFVGLAILGFLMLALLIFRAVGGPAGASCAAVGLMASFISGVAVSSVFDYQIPGLAENASASQGAGFLGIVLASVIVGILAMYSSWRFD